MIDEVAEEFAAVEQALRGDLSGRAGQAGELTQLDASPVQIAAADRLLREGPVGGEELLTGVEPTAACVAAAHWVAAAVVVTLRSIGRTESREVLDPDGAAEPFDTVAPRIVVDLILGGNSPLAAVQRLIRPAMAAARGSVPAEADGFVPGLIVVDPTRPAPHLLDRLLLALQTCQRVYREPADPAECAGGADPVDAAGRPFDRAVRREAARTADRLLSAAVTPA